MPPEKKRVSLPVLRDDADENEERPASAWIVLGAVGILVILVPLAGIAWKIGGGHVTPTVVAAIVSIALASFCGGWLAGRFGKGVAARHGAGAGAIAGIALWAIDQSAPGGVVLVVTVPFASFGAHLGRRARK